MEHAGRHAVLDDGDVLPAPCHGLPDHRSTCDAGDRRRENAGERCRPRSGDRPGDGNLGAVVVAGVPRPPGSDRQRAMPGDDRAAPPYRRAGSRPAEPDAATPVG